MLKNLLRPFVFLLSFTLLFVVSCDDDNSTIPVIKSESCAIVINQGSQGYLPGTLDVLSLSDNSYTPSALTLAGTPENVVECSGYFFVPLFDNNTIAVYDKSSLRAVSTIAVPTPQSVCTDGENVFAIGNDSIFRINATSLAVEAADTVGHTAFASVYASGNVYVAIGRGWGQTEGGDLLAKVNPQTLQCEYIKVGINPYNQMVADESGNVFVVCAGNYYDIPSTVYKVTPQGDVKSIAPATTIAVGDGVLYVANRTSSYDEAWNETSSCTFSTYNASTGSLLSKDFLGDAAEQPATATFIAFSPLNGDLYIGAQGVTEAGYVSYTTTGYVYRYTSDGTFVEKYTAGVSPYAMLFYTRRVAEN